MDEGDETLLYGTFLLSRCVVVRYVMCISVHKTKKCRENMRVKAATATCRRLRTMYCCCSVGNLEVSALSLIART